MKMAFSILREYYFASGFDKTSDSRDDREQPKRHLSLHLSLSSQTSHHNFFSLYRTFLSTDCTSSSFNLREMVVSASATLVFERLPKHIAATKPNKTMSLDSVLTMKQKKEKEQHVAVTKDITVINPQAEIRGDVSVPIPKSIVFPTRDTPIR